MKDISKGKEASWNTRLSRFLDPGTPEQQRKLVIFFMVWLCALLGMTILLTRFNNSFFSWTFCSIFSIILLSPLFFLESWSKQNNKEDADSAESDKDEV